MAYDTSEPRNKQILLWGVLSVLTLFALVPLFHSYFGITMGEEFAEKVYEVPNTPYEELRDAQRAEIRTSPISVDQAMEQLASRGRTNTPVMPRPNDTPDLSEDDYEASLAPVVGWSQLPHEQAAEAARRAMRSRREALLIETGVDDPSATTVEQMQQNTEPFDPPSTALPDGVRPTSADEPVRRPPAQLVRPTAMVAGMRPTPMVAEPAP